MSLINLNQINLVDSTAIASEGAIIIARQSQDNIWSSNYTGAILLPTSSSTERDVAISVASEGYIHYNTTSTEFEGFTNGSWRPVSQLTKDGTALNPARSFVNDQTSGSFLIAPGILGFSASGNERIRINSSETIVNDNFNIDSTVNNNDAIQKIKTPSNKIGSIIWADSTVDKSFIRYNHLTDIFEVSGEGTDLSFTIDGTSNTFTILSPLVIDGPMSFGSGIGPFATVDAIFTSSGGFTFTLDDDNDDTTSVFKIQKHLNIPTGFEVTQDGTVTANNGLVTNPSFNFSSSTDSGWYFKTTPIATMNASFQGVDKIALSTSSINIFDTFKLIDGSAAIPSLTFNTDTNTGLYKSGVDSLSITTAGSEKLQINNSIISNLIPIGLSDGLVSSPSLTFSSDITTGFFKDGINSIGITNNNNQTLKIDSSGITMSPNKIIVTSSGTVTIPSISFVGDLNTGIYNRNNNEIGITTNGIDRIYTNNNETHILNNLINEKSQFLGIGSNDIEILPTVLVALTANVIDQPLLAPLTYDGTIYNAVIVDYLIKRDVGLAVGTLHIASDGINVTFTDTSANINNTGITFNVTITSGTVEVKYTSTAGSNAVLKYGLKRWGI